MTHPPAPGAWPSPITPAVVTAAAVSLGGPVCDGDHLWWSELRPAEAGRVQLVRRRLDHAETPTDVLPDGFSARTRVHEYGGGAWWVAGGLAVFSNWTDQRLWAWRPGIDAEPWPLTAEALDREERFADLRLVDAPDGTTWVLAVREHHGTVVGGDHAEPTNDLVAVRVVADGAEPARPVVLVAGADFVSHPRPSPDATAMAWLQWDHPRMPWDGTELWAAALDFGPDGPVLAQPRRVAGGPDESIAQPEWAPTGHLHLVSDRSHHDGDDDHADDGWWSLYRCAEPGLPTAGPDGAAALEPVLVVDRTELAQPQWVFGQSWYAWAPDETLVACGRCDGRDRLLVGAPAPVTVLDRYTAVDGLTATTWGVAAVAAGFDAEPSVIELVDVAGALVAGQDPTVVVHRTPRALGIDPSWWSTPQHVEVSGPGGVVRALVYPPTNPEVVVEAQASLPPLLVLIHGGPTSAARPMLALATQYWTSRGFCVADVNYRGSTGYGRRYRRALDGAWGVADVEDVCAVAADLATRRIVDAGRMAIRGGSAGGFTVLGALLSPDGAFGVAACLYAVTDLAGLVADTHKFEAHYTDTLVGPWPEAADVYRQRSPVHHLDHLGTPVIVFQGLDDAVVPPSQAEALVAALDEAQVPHAYVAFAGEQHGFRQAATIERVLRDELYFYRRVLGIAEASATDGDPEAAPAPDLVIHHLDATSGT